MLGSLYSLAIGFATERDQNQSNANPLVAVSKEFQQSVSAMFPTVSAQQNSSVTLSDLEVFSHSKTFAVIKDIDIYVKNIDEFRKLFDLCQPLFSDLLHLTLRLDFSFDHGDEVADFIFRFRALKSIEIRSQPNRSLLPEVFTFFNKLFNTPYVARFVVYVDSFSSFLENHTFSRSKSPQAPEFRSLMNQHRIRPFLARKMIEVYEMKGMNRKDEFVVIFVKALVHSLYSLLNNNRTIDSQTLLNELKPCLDFIKPLILNNDLLKECYVPTLDALRFSKFSLIEAVVELFSYSTSISPACSLEFMKQYGRDLIPVLADSVFSISDVDRSRGAFGSVATIIRLFSNVVADYFWTDELTESSTIEDFKRVEKKGYTFLQHVPFDKCAIAIKDFFDFACKLQHHESHYEAYTVFVFSYFFLSKITVYFASFPHFANEMAQDVAARMNDHQILQALFSCVKQLFERNEKSEDPKLPISFHVDRLVECLKEMLCRSGPRDTSSFTKLNANALFSGDEGEVRVDQIIDIMIRACKMFEEEIKDLQKDVSQWNKETDVAEMKKKQVALDETRKFISNLSGVAHAADQVVKANMIRFSKSSVDYRTLNEKHSVLQSALHDKNKLIFTVDQKLADLKKKLNERVS